MAINIKDSEAEKMIRKLAALTGETLTETIKVSVQERFERERRLCDSEDRYQRGLAMIKEMNRGLKEKPASDHSHLYDEFGLPKS